MFLDESHGATIMTSFSSHNGPRWLGRHNGASPVFLCCCTQCLAAVNWTVVNGSLILPCPTHPQNCSWDGHHLQCCGVVYAPEHHHHQHHHHPTPNQAKTRLYLNYFLACLSPAPQSLSLMPSQGFPEEHVPNKSCTPQCFSQALLLGNRT